MVRTEFRLKFFIEVIIGEMGFDLCGNNTLQVFDRKGKVGDGLIEKFVRGRKESLLVIGASVSELSKVGGGGQCMLGGEL